MMIDKVSVGNSFGFEISEPPRGHYGKLLTGVSLLALSTALAVPPRTAKADTIAPSTALTGTVNGGGAGGFMVINGATMTVTGATVSNFTAIGYNYTEAAIWYIDNPSDPLASSGSGTTFDVDTVDDVRIFRCYQEDQNTAYASFK